MKRILLILLILNLGYSHNTTYSHHNIQLTNRTLGDINDDGDIY